MISIYYGYKSYPSFQQALSHPQDVKWFEYITLEISKGHFATRPTGELCMECGQICEAHPNESIESITEQYKSNVPYKILFETCRQVLRGNAPRAWRASLVHRSTKVGQRCELSLYAIEEANLTKWYKTQASLDLNDLKAIKWSELKNPEGQTVTVIILKSANDIPSQVPFFKIDLFSEECTVHEDIFLDRGEEVHEHQGSMTHGFLLNEDLKERSIRLAGIPQTITWAELDSNVAAGQKALQEKEAERMRQIQLADSGQACETHCPRVLSASRLKRPAPQEAMGAPASRGKAGGKGRGRATSKGRGRMGAPRSRSDGSPSHVGSKVVLGSGQGMVAQSFKEGAPSHAGSEAGPDDELPKAGAADASTLPEKLQTLLTSTHGKKFPGIQAIIGGQQIKRELSGVSASACPSQAVAIHQCLNHEPSATFAPATSCSQAFHMTSLKRSAHACTNTNDHIHHPFVGP